MPASDVLSAILTSAFLASVLRVTTPILLPALGGLVSELAGVVNIALEGTMLVAAFTGVLVGAYSGSAWLGMAAALVVAVLFSLLLGVFHLELKADPVLTGLALNIFASSGTVFLLYSLTGDKGSSSKLASPTMPYINLPFLETLPVLGPVLNGQNVLVYIAFLLVPLVGFFLYRSVPGAHLRAVGSSPEAAATAGIGVRRMRYAALALSGLLCGLGGVHMSMGYLQLFQRDMTAGRGFIALAAVFMGGRRPWGVMLAALVFGTADALSNQLGSINIPSQLVQMLPYAATVIALAVYAIVQQRAALARQRRFSDAAR